MHKQHFFWNFIWILSTTQKFAPSKPNVRWWRVFFFFHLKFEQFYWNSFFFSTKTFKDVKFTELFSNSREVRCYLLIQNWADIIWLILNNCFFFVPNFFNLSKCGIWKIDWWEFTFKEFFVLKIFALALLPNKQRHIALCLDEMGIFSTA